IAEEEAKKVPQPGSVGHLKTCVEAQRQEVARARKIVIANNSKLAAIRQRQWAQRYVAAIRELVASCEDWYRDDAEVRAACGGELMPPYDEIFPDQKLFGQVKHAQQNSASTLEEHPS